MKDKLEEKLTGTTLRVYFTLLRNNSPLTLRQIQKIAGLSSPSLALYHLEKLKDLELVESANDEGFIVSQTVRVGILQFFLGKGSFLLPRYFFYFVFFFVELCFYLFFFGFRVIPESVILVVTLALVAVFSLIEGVVMWRNRPA